MTSAADAYPGASYQALNLASANPLLPSPLDA
jgi:hypothetical protein